MKSPMVHLSKRVLLIVRAHGNALAVVGAVALILLVLDRASGMVGGGRVAQLVVALGVPFALASDGLGIRSGVAVLWVQRPVDPIRYYLAQFGERVTASMVVTAVLEATIISVALWWGWEPLAHPLRILFVTSLVPLLIISMAFGASVWLPRTGQLVVAAVVAVTVSLELVLVLNPDLLQSGRRWLPWARGILVPWRAFIELGVLEGLNVSAAAPLMRIFAYAGAWIGVGALGVGRVLSNGTLSRSGLP